MILERVLVVGAGQMGGGIAQVVAASGRAVLLHDTFPGAVENHGPSLPRAASSARRCRSRRTEYLSLIHI